jgi:hypothetical protein
VARLQRAAQQGRGARHQVVADELTGSGAPGGDWAMSRTRRQFVAGAGAALVVPATASAASEIRVGVAPEGREAMGVIGTILQDARRLTGFGYVTHVPA